MDRTNNLNTENARLKAQVEMLRNKANSRSPTPTQRQGSDQYNVYNKDEYEYLKTRFNNLKSRMDTLVTEKNRSTSRARASVTKSSNQQAKPIASTTPEFNDTNRGVQMRDSNRYTGNTAYNVHPDSSTNYNRPPNNRVEYVQPQTVDRR